VPGKPFIVSMLTAAGRAAWRSLPALLLVTPGCLGRNAGPTSCDGLADKTLAITKTDYSKCAGEILGALDEFETSLRRFADGDAAAKDPSRAASARLAHLMGEVGFRGDAGLEVRGGAGRVIERWPDAAMREFNAEVVIAAAQFNAVLAYPNRDNLQQGARLHAQAASSYSRFR